MSNRFMYEFVSADTVHHWTQNNILNSNRKVHGITAYFKWKPFKGSAVDLTFRQDFASRDPFMYISGSEYLIDTVNTKYNFNYTLSMAINEDLVSKIKFAKVYLNQVHGGYYPKGGAYLTSWGFNTGFDMLTAPLFFNLAFEAGLNFSYIDLNDDNGNFGFPNNNIDAGDNVIEFFLGVRWGFM
jgi:hypothetical protein